ncbi:hypothetical protein FKR81_12205 [Lentzea tibetensis]|uniref:Novel STAND NTPase 1 domain-containing protein n=1 Tax=Lentzea tibetensis TaxID=2591470 RepID=A0A563EXD1_9PSEU|nr:NACHT and WD repeat domain-containing protein [Lentzea tibetensis]TWP52319.1 hypothetical protein FKR81_12205 [Lentzea tibetensis]
MPRGERPLESGDAALTRFAADLRLLREKAGSPPYRSLGQRAHYSAATLSEAAGGRKLPTLAVTLAYVAACGGDLGEWEARWRELAVGEEPAPALESPYVGLAAFQAADADRFFGRENLTGKLLELVGSRRFVGVFGASGSGKSSLLRAGLVPALPGRALVLTPGANPVEECAVRLAALMGVSAVELKQEFAADPANLWLRVRQFEPELVLVVDQFEEAFTLAPDAHWLVRALTGGPRVVLGVRADFYGHCGRYPELVESLEGSQLLVGPMTSDELRRAITEPAARAGATVETALVARLVADVAGQAAALPLVSHALVETWRRRRGMTLSLNGYEAAGGIEHAVARTAEEVFFAFSPDEQRAARLLFLRLIALGEGTEDTKRRVPRRELDADSLLDRLVSARLVTLDRDSVELTHEALIRSWPRLRDWIAEDRDGLRAHRQLIDATDAWEAHGRDPDALYRGVRLVQAKDLGEVLSGREREFLDASVVADTARQVAVRRRTRRLRLFVALLSVLVLLLAGVVLYANSAEQTSVEQRNNALSLRAADAAVDLIGTDSRDAVRIALAAYRVSATAEARDALSAAQAEITKSLFAGKDENGAMGMYLSPQGNLALGTDRDGRMFLTDIASGTFEPAGTLPETGFPEMFSGDERVLLTRTGVGEAGTSYQLWDIAVRHRMRKIAQWTKPAVVQDVNAAGDVLAVMGQRLDGSGGQANWVPTGVLTLLRVTSSGQVEEVPVPAADVQSAELSADGRRMVLVRRDATIGNVIEIWETGAELRRLRMVIGSDGYLQAKISPDGRFVVVPDRALKVLRVYEVSDGAVEWSAVSDTTATSLVVEFASDSKTLIVSTEGRVLLWNVELAGRPQRIASFGGLGGLLEQPVYRPEKKDVLLIDRNTGLWRFDLDTDRLIATACNSRDMDLPAARWNDYFLGVKPISVCS